jgi:hypothetical protein
VEDGEKNYEVEVTDHGQCPPTKESRIEIEDEEDDFRVAEASHKVRSG